jgi:hypothetical protein
MIPTDVTSVPLTGTVPGLGAYPTGDPGAIRAVADQLRAVAATLSGVDKPSVDGWKSPRAADVRARLAAAASTAHDHAADLRGLAGSLDTAAGHLEADQRAWRIGKRRLMEQEAKP